MTGFNPPLRLCLDGGALIANWRALAKLSGAASTGAAVKANGYGLGAREVVTRLSAVGCRDFFVAHWAEAEAIADLIPASQVAVLNGIGDSDVQRAIALGAIPVLNTPHQIAMWKAANGGRCHVMLDSGINRLGIGPEQMSVALLDGLDIDIALSHLASADEDVMQNASQRATYLSMLQQARCQRRSLANSAGIMLGADYHFDLTRPGLSLYGGIARPEMADIMNQVVYPQARVLQVRELMAGQSIGYNATYTTPTPSRIATLAIGYADGYLRGFSGTGMCQFEGIALPVVGRVSMDLVTVDASNCPTLNEGDWIDVDLVLQRAAAASGLSQYELLTGLSARASRAWK